MRLSQLTVPFLQRGKEVTVEGAAGEVALAMRPAGTRPTTVARPSSTVTGSHMMEPATRSPGRGEVDLLACADRFVRDPSLLLAGAAPLHNAVYDGHPIYRWDQESMLRAVFSLIDTDGSGRIGRSQVKMWSGVAGGGLINVALSSDIGDGQELRAAESSSIYCDVDAS